MHKIVLSGIITAMLVFSLVSVSAETTTPVSSIEPIDDEVCHVNCNPTHPEPTSAPSQPGRGHGKYKCQAEYGWDGYHWAIRDIIIQKSYSSLGQTKLKDVKVSGKKCRYKGKQFPVVKGIPSDMTPLRVNVTR